MIFNFVAIKLSLGRIPLEVLNILQILKLYVDGILSTGRMVKY